MPNREDITYFGAGPALLPTDVLEKASQALLNYNDTGLGIAGKKVQDWMPHFTQRRWRGC